MMLPGLSPRSASRTGSNPRPLERALTFANSFPNAIGEEEVKEEADEPALEALRSAGDDSPVYSDGEDDGGAGLFDSDSEEEARAEVPTVKDLMDSSVGN